MKIKINKINYITLVVMCINNFLAFPMIIFNILKKKKESIFLIGLYFGILGFYYQGTTGTSDIERYYTMIDNGIVSWKQFFLSDKDFYAKFLSLFIIKNNLPKNLLGMASGFLSYYFLYSSLKILLDKYRIKNRLKYYVILFIITPIIEYTGIRFLPAVAVFLYGYLLKTELDKNKGYIYMVSSIFIHYSMILSFFLFVFSKIGKKYLKNRKMINYILIISFIVGIIGSIKLIIMLTMIFPLEYRNIILAYTTSGGNWGIDYGKQFNFIGKLFNVYFFPNFIKLNIIFYTIAIFRKKEKKDLFICLLISFYFITMYDFFVISERYSRLIIYIIYFEIIKIKNSNFIFNNKVKTVLLLLLIERILFMLIILKYNYMNFIVSYSEFYKVSLLNIIYEILKIN